MHILENMMSKAEVLYFIFKMCMCACVFNEAKDNIKDRYWRVLYQHGGIRGEISSLFFTIYYFQNFYKNHTTFRKWLHWYITLYACNIFIFPPAYNTQICSFNQFYKNWVSILDINQMIDNLPFVLFIYTTDKIHIYLYTCYRQKRLVMSWYDHKMFQNRFLV